MECMESMCHLSTNTMSPKQHSCYEKGLGYNTLLTDIRFIVVLLLYLDQGGQGMVCTLKTYHTSNI